MLILSVKWKICYNCHHKVDISAKVCPYCNEDYFKEIDISFDEMAEYEPIKSEIKELFEYCDLIDNRGDYDEKLTPILADFKSKNNSVRDLVQTNIADFLTFIAVKGDSFSDFKLLFIDDA